MSIRLCASIKNNKHATSIDVYNVCKTNVKIQCVFCDTRYILFRIFVITSFLNRILIFEKIKRAQMMLCKPFHTSVFYSISRYWLGVISLAILCTKITILIDSSYRPHQAKYDWIEDRKTDGNCAQKLNKMTQIEWIEKKERWSKAVHYYYYMCTVYADDGRTW